jgi:hypothetical protein
LTKAAHVAGPSGLIAYSLIASAVSLAQFDNVELTQTSARVSESIFSPIRLAYGRQRFRSATS